MIAVHFTCPVERKNLFANAGECLVSVYGRGQTMALRCPSCGARIERPITESQALRLRDGGAVLQSRQLTEAEVATFADELAALGENADLVSLVLSEQPT